jgi:hypothetical protein
MAVFEANRFWAYAVDIFPISEEPKSSWNPGLGGGI